MRVSDKSITNLVKRNLLENRSRLADFQTKAATQKRIVKPSDDPISSVRILGSRIEEKMAEQFTKNAHFANSFLEYTDQSLAELGEMLVRAKELTLGQVNDASANPITRKVTSAEIEQIFWQAVQVGNRKLGDRYIFAGHETSKAPFDQSGKYLGDRGDVKAQVNKDTYIAMNVPGGQVFIGEELADDGVSRARLETPTTVEELRQFKQRTLKPSDEKKFQNQRPLVYSDDPVSGNRTPASQSQAMNVNDASPAGGRGAGVNLFHVLSSVDTALKTSDKDTLQDMIPLLDQAISQVIMSRSEVGSRSMALKGEIESLTKLQLDAKTLTSSYEDVDAFKVVADLQGAQNTLETTLKTSGGLIQPSLLDFLR